MLLEQIEMHLRARRMTPTRFGREAVGDPNLIAQLREGRELRAATKERIADYLNRNESRERPVDRRAVRRTG